jgi:ABC-type Zn uptake system ZnuABC Zn-binding protein ZnuA
VSESKQYAFWKRIASVTILLLAALLVACNAAAPAQPASTPAPQPAAASHDDDGRDNEDHDADDDHGDDEILSLPRLPAVQLAAGERLQVVATTSIIGDVAAQVAGDAVQLTTLMAAGQDPHGFSPSAAQLTAVANAHVIFINGWDLEEGLLRDLENISEGRVPLLPVSAGVEPLYFEEDDDDHGDDDHDHGPIDPHTWFDVTNVMQWVDNLVRVLSDLDPANADLYHRNGDAYLEELRALEAYVRERAATAPADRRKLVTNHDALGYFTRAYDFEVVGTVIPGASTLAEPSARDLATLVETMRQEQICVVFVETIASDRLAQVVAGELTTCDDVRVLSLYTDALGAPGSGADTYVGLMRYTVDTIIDGLSDG